MDAARTTPHVRIDAKSATVVGLEHAAPRSVDVWLDAGAGSNPATGGLLGQIPPEVVRRVEVAPHAGLATLSMFDGTQLDDLVVCERGLKLPRVSMRSGGRVEVWHPDDGVSRLLTGHLASVRLRGGRLSRLEVGSIDNLFLAHCTRLVEIRGRVVQLFSNVCSRLRLGPDCLGLKCLTVARGLGTPLEDLGRLDGLVRLAIFGVPRLAAVDVTRLATLRTLRLVRLDAKDATVAKWSAAIPHAWFTNSLGDWRGGVRLTDAASIAEVRRLRDSPLSTT